MCYVKTGRAGYKRWSGLPCIRTGTNWTDPQHPDRPADSGFPVLGIQGAELSENASSPCSHHRSDKRTIGRHVRMFFRFPRLTPGYIRLLQVCESEKLGLTWLYLPSISWAFILTLKLSILLCISNTKCWVTRSWKWIALYCNVSSPDSWLWFKTLKTKGQKSLLMSWVWILDDFSLWGVEESGSSENFDRTESSHGCNNMFARNWFHWSVKNCIDRNGEYSKLVLVTLMQPFYQSGISTVLVVTSWG